MPLASIETWKDPDAVDAFARNQYLDQCFEKPAFHHYPHARLTRHIAGILATTAIRNGANIETDVLPVAAAYHDAGAATWHSLRHRFATPEELAVEIATDVLLLDLGMPKAKVTSATEAIRETSRWNPCTTDTSRCLSQADLMAGGILSHDAVFLNGTYRLYKESKQQDSQPVPDDRDTLRGELLDFGAISHDVLSTYLEEDLALGPHQRNERGESLFNILARQKIQLLKPARFARILDVNLDYLVGFEPASLRL